MAFKRALVVDDSKLARVALKKLLEEHELAVEFAESGEEALERLATAPFQVILLDIQLPGMNGVECLRALREFDRESVAMMITGYAAPGLIDDALSAGAVRVLHKPLDSMALLELIGHAAAP